MRFALFFISFPHSSSCTPLFLHSPSLPALPPYFHSRESGNLFPQMREIPRQRNVDVGVCAGGGDSACGDSALRKFPLAREEIPAFAGMERGAGMEVGGEWNEGEWKGGWRLGDVFGEVAPGGVLGCY